MYAKSILAMLAAVITLGLIGSLVQASPAISGESITAVSATSVCEATPTESYCQTVGEEEDEESSMIEGLMSDDSDDE